VSSHGSSDEGTIGENKNFGSTDKLYLLSLQEVYGTSGINNDSSNGTSRQLDYYAIYEGADYTGVSTTNYGGAIKLSERISSWWWLRSAGSTIDYYFYSVNSIGERCNSDAYFSGGVSPAFRIG
jgi:hypothetical protein